MRITTRLLFLSLIALLISATHATSDSKSEEAESTAAAQILREIEKVDKLVTKANTVLAHLAKKPGEQPNTPEPTQATNETPQLRISPEPNDSKS